MSLSSIAKSLGSTVKQYGPEILTGIGVAGMITTVILAVKATKPALEKIEEKKEELNIEKLTPKETVEAAWKCYIPTVMVGTASVACIIGASSVNLRRNTALAAAYSLSTTTAKEYKDKVIEMVGEKKEKDIRDNIAKDHIDRNPVSSKEVIVTGNGKTRCYDVMSDRYFESDINTLKSIVNDLNMRMRSDNYISLNDFYYELDLNGIDPRVGDHIGWDISKGLYIQLDFGSHLCEDGTPCISINHVNAPQYIS